jgi:hypothetical protein
LLTQSDHRKRKTDPSRKLDNNNLVTMSKETDSFLEDSKAEINICYKKILGFFLVEGKYLNIQYSNQPKKKKKELKMDKFTAETNVLASNR